MPGILDTLSSLLDFLMMLVHFPVWLINNLPSMINVLSVAVQAIPSFLYPIALFSLSLIVVMAFVKLI